MGKKGYTNPVKRASIFVLGGEKKSVTMAEKKEGRRGLTTYSGCCCFQVVVLLQECVGSSRVVSRDHTFSCNRTHLHQKDKTKRGVGSVSIENE